MSTPDVSIVIPCFNYAHFLRQAIDSAREQSGARAEVIVVDDGSTDDTSRIVGEYPGVRLLRQPNMGLSAARNTGLRFCRADFVVFLDADDMLLPDAAALGCGLLRRRPDAAIACGRCRLIDESGGELTTGAPQPVGDYAYARLLGTNFIWTPGAAVLRRSAVTAIGGFTMAWAAAADYRLYLTIARRHAVIDHSTEVVLYRQHSANMSNNPVLMLGATLAVLRDERRHVPPRWRTAFRQGRRAWQNYYGDRIANEMRMLIRQKGGTLQAARMAGALFWYHPVGFARHFARKLGTTLGLRPAVPDLPPISPRPSGAIPPATAVGERMAPSRPAR